MHPVGCSSISPCANEFTSGTRSPTGLGEGDDAGKSEQQPRIKTLPAELSWMSTISGFSLLIAKQVLPGITIPNLRNSSLASDTGTSVHLTRQIGHKQCNVPSACPPSISRAHLLQVIRWPHGTATRTAAYCQQIPQHGFRRASDTKHPLPPTACFNNASLLACSLPQPQVSTDCRQ